MSVILESMKGLSSPVMILTKPIRKKDEHTKIIEIVLSTILGFTINAVTKNIIVNKLGTAKLKNLLRCWSTSFKADE